MKKQIEFEQIFDHTKETMEACKKQIDAYHAVLQSMAMCGVKMGAVLLSDHAAKDMLVVRLSFGMSGASNKIIKASSPGEMASYDSLRNSKIIFVEYKDSEYAKSDLEHKLEIQNALFVPIVDKNIGSAIGVLMCVCDKDEAVFEFISRVAGLLGENISKMQSLKSGYADSGDSDTDVMDIGELPRAFQQCVDAANIEELSDRVLEWCLKLTSSQFGFVGYIDNETGFLICPTMTKDIFPSCGVDGKSVVFEKAGGLGGFVLDNKKPLVANDPVTHPASVGTPSGHIPIRKFMGVPCLYRDSKVGMIALANKDEDYTAADLEVATLFGALYASCVAGFFAKEELVSSKEAFKKLYDDAPCGYFTIKSDGSVIQSNNTLQKLLRQEPKNIILHLTKESTDTLKEYILGFQTRDSQTPVELEFISLEGEVISTVFSSVCKKDERGYLQELFCTAVDVTELKRAQKMLNELLVSANKDLSKRIDDALLEIKQKDSVLVKQSRLAAMGEAISTVAHEWRQPLNALGIFVQDIKITYREGELTKEYIESTTKRCMELIFSMSQTIDNFRKLYGKESSKSGKFRIDDAVAMAVEQLKLKGLPEKIGIDISLPKEALFVSGVLYEFSQALYNILENAKEAIERDGFAHPAISIRAVCGGSDSFVLEIENRGSKIPDEKIDKIFEPYFSTKPEASGVGLGLFIAKIIVERMLGGEISVSNSEEGVKFSISLPLQKE